MPSDEEDIKPEVRKHHRPFRDPPWSNNPIQGCVDHDGISENVIHEFGDVWRDSKECNRKTCYPNGTIVEEVCPEVEVPEGCVLVRGNAEYYQDFPYCCDRVACPGDDGYWEEDPEDPDPCYDKYCLRWQGDVWSEHKYGICNRKRCGRNKYNEPKIFEETCPKLEVPKGCHLEAYPDLTKEFPDCCEKIVCPPDHPAHNDPALANVIRGASTGTGGGKGADAKSGPDTGKQSTSADSSDVVTAKKTQSESKRIEAVLRQFK